MNVIASGARAWYFWTLIVFFVLLHFTLHVTVGLGASAPDLLTVSVLVAARRLTGSAAAALGLVLGLLEDSLALDAFGAQAVTLTIIGYLGARSRDLFVGDSLLFVGVYLFIGKWLHDVIYYLLAGSAVRGDAVFRLLVQAPLAALYAAGVGLLALVAYRAVTGER
ncbi:MAG TPA: rod shape-determining protein MreD [Longimicrobiales bacterium]